MTQGGASVEMIERIGGAFATISIGASMKTPLDSLCKINPAIKALLFDSIGGLRASDKLISAQMELSAKESCGEIKRRRAPIKSINPKRLSKPNHLSLLKIAFRA